LRSVPLEAILPAALATAVGSNLGANLTPIGALAGIMWMTILTEKDFRISFLEFMKYGFLVTPVSLLACLSVLALEFLI
jgi:Na+/H+ antiporter NhaD and related arsenite permeases